MCRGKFSVKQVLVKLLIPDTCSLDLILKRFTDRKGSIHWCIVASQNIFYFRGIPSRSRGFPNVLSNQNRPITYSVKTHVEVKQALRQFGSWGITTVKMFRTIRPGILRQCQVFVDLFYKFTIGYYFLYFLNCFWCNTQVLFNNNKLCHKLIRLCNQGCIALLGTYRDTQSIEQSANYSWANSFYLVYLGAT